ncbi:hypothetical protein [Advenella sp. FME57]|uniref:Uncharacterized protein n=1 Tax=Advenella kashmirensis TaxID=310575 RepID=A0A356LD31_9BURK|nr:hypothetical protein [Advenella sp. FME57]HBP28461.1 hypothetical protein [Advenella kashmirensis]
MTVNNSDHTTSDCDFSDCWSSNCGASDYYSEMHFTRGIDLIEAGITGEIYAKRVSCCTLQADQ